jgi:hypothetical protein
MRFGSGPVRRYQPIGGGAGQTKLTDSQFANRAPALTAEDTLQRLFRRVVQPAVEVAVLRALRLLPSNVAGECAFSDPILIVTSFLRSPVPLSVAAAGQTQHI